jgi:Transposase zinc-binding domain
MSACRSAALGAHVARCQDCAYTTIAYNSCRNHLFRRLFLDRLTAAHKQLQFFGNHTPLADAQAFAAYLAPLRKTEWVVYSKRPFGGPEAVLVQIAARSHSTMTASPSSGRITESRAEIDKSR